MTTKQKPKPQLTLHLANFPVEQGVGVIVVPSGALFQHSTNASAHPETPLLALLNRSDCKGGGFYFKSRGEQHKKGPLFGFSLFVPKGTKPGDKLVIDWRMPKCAGARFATQAEVDAVTPQPTPSPSDSVDAAPHWHSTRPLMGGGSL